VDESEMTAVRAGNDAIRLATRPAKPVPYVIADPRPALQVMIRGIRPSRTGFAGIRNLLKGRNR